MLGPDLNDRVRTLGDLLGVEWGGLPRVLTRDQALRVFDQMTGRVGVLVHSHRVNAETVERLEEQLQALQLRPPPPPPAPHAPTADPLALGPALSERTPSGPALDGPTDPGLSPGAPPGPPSGRSLDGPSPAPPGAAPPEAGLAPHASHRSLTGSLPGSDRGPGAAAEASGDAASAGGSSRDGRPPSSRDGVPPGLQAPEPERGPPRVMWQTEGGQESGRTHTTHSHGSSRQPLDFIDPRDLINFWPEPGSIRSKNSHR